MDQNASSTLDLPTLFADVLSLIDWPAVIVADGELVLARNALWDELALTIPDENGKNIRTLEQSLHGFKQVEGLAQSLTDGQSAVGMITAYMDIEPHAGAGPVRKEFTVRWRHLHMRPDDRTIALVVVQNTTPMSQLASVISSQHARINQLLIRQTLIEEAERRRIGQELHDGAAQVLAQVRQAIDSGLCTGDAIPEWKAKIDRVIENIRTLSFELSPPILEDLGLLPAMEWLVEHLSERYGADIQLVDDGVEPRLSSEARTIVFRSVRELVLNAAKHASGAEIVVSCVSDELGMRIIVKDTGPGFDTYCVSGAAHGKHRYGLLSVEQQIRGIGGSFEISSSPGEGTRATIMVSFAPREETAT